MATRKTARKVPPKHQYVSAGAGRTKCEACSAMQGGAVEFCRNDYSKLSLRQQAKFYRDHGLCGKCGQVVSSMKVRCRCKDCGCFKLHEAAQPAVEEPGLFDIEPESTSREMEG